MPITVLLSVTALNHWLHGLCWLHLYHSFFHPEHLFLIPWNVFHFLQNGIKEKNLLPQRLSPKIELKTTSVHFSHNPVVSYYYHVYLIFLNHCFLFIFSNFFWITLYYTTRFSTRKIQNRNPHYLLAPKDVYLEFWCKFILHHFQLHYFNDIS